MDLAQKLIARWDSHGIECPPGVSACDITEFESRHAVHMPSDLREYFFAVNGMGQKGVYDNDFYSFWPLHDVRTIAEGLPERTKEDSALKQHFVIADHSVFLPGFAIRLTGDDLKGNPVVRVHTDLEIEEAFCSFTEFVEYYLRDPLGATVASTLDR